MADRSFFFCSDVVTVGRLILAHDGNWDIEGDVDAQLRHKLSESLWSVIVTRNEIRASATSPTSALKV